MTMLDTATRTADAGDRRDDRVGIWLVGARGSIGTTVAVGLHVIANELAAPTGCTTAGDEFVGVPLAALRRPRARRPRHQHHPAHPCARRRSPTPG